MQLYSCSVHVLKDVQVLTRKLNFQAGRFGAQIGHQQKNLNSKISFSLVEFIRKVQSCDETAS